MNERTDGHKDHYIPRKFVCRGYNKWGGDEVRYVYDKNHL